jgi:hypothetical protein
MPSREEERWTSEKSDLRYCPKHKRYYGQDAGCQLCGWEELERIRQQKQTATKLQKCPGCKEESLFWNTFFGLYECLNLDCERRFTKAELEKATDTAKIQEAFRQPSDRDVDEVRRQEREREPTLKGQALGEHNLKGTIGCCLIYLAMAGAIFGIVFWVVQGRGESWLGPHGESEIEVLNIVGADGHRITLVNNPDAMNPTWSELVSFLQHDKTDKQTYDYASFVCADFAEMLHNNAEAAGIMAAYVTVDLASSEVGHALNAFDTTDRGRVYIDDTGPLAFGSEYPSTCSADKIVTIEVGIEYIPESIFDCPGYSSTWESMGEVTAFQAYW